MLGSCGQPAHDARVRLAAEDGTPVAAGEVGEIQVQAPFQMAGYHRADELTAETVTRGRVGPDPGPAAWTSAATCTSSTAAAT